MRTLTFVSSICVALALTTGCMGGHPRHPIAVSESEAIFVSGEGEASGTPDRMRLNLGVEAKAETLDAAMKDCQQRSAALKEALLKLGVKEQDLKTGQFSISQQREPVLYTVNEAVPAPVPPAKPVPKGGKVVETTVAPAPSSAPATRVEERWIERYVVSNTLEVLYPDLTRAGELITKAVEAGANNSWGISFEVADPKPLQSEARKAALADAKVRAEQIASETGVKLGRVLSVSDGSDSSGPMPPMPMYKMAAMDASMPIEGGQTKLRTSVHVVYAIDR